MCQCMTNSWEVKWSDDHEITIFVQDYSSDITLIIENLVEFSFKGMVCFWGGGLWGWESGPI